MRIAPRTDISASRLWGGAAGEAAGGGGAKAVSGGGFTGGPAKLATVSAAMHEEFRPRCGVVANSCRSRRKERLRRGPAGGRGPSTPPPGGGRRASRRFVRIRASPYPPQPNLFPVVRN